MFFLGYVLGLIVSISGLAIILAALYKASNLKPTMEHRRTPVPLQTRAVISFSLVLPFLILGFAATTLPGMSLAKNLISQGHGDFVIAALALPTFCFLAGYFYFKKVLHL